MKSQLQAELKQSKPFPSREVEAAVSIARTAAVLEHQFLEALRPYGITPTQYNVLRILRGAGKQGLCRNEVGERLVARMPDATRLLDRMVDLGLVERNRDGEDRRFVSAKITTSGMDILERLDEPVARLHQEQFGHLGAKRLEALIDALAEVRSACC